MFDDKGWIFTDIVNYSIIAFSRFASDFSFFDTKNYYKEGVSSSFYNLNIYCERDYDVIYRSYMKFQNLCADVGGLFKILLTVFENIAYFYNINSRKNIIFNEMFDLFNCDETNVKVNGNAGSKKKAVLGKQISESSNFFNEDFVKKAKRKSIILQNVSNKEKLNLAVQNDFTNSNLQLNSGDIVSKHLSVKMQMEELRKKEKDKMSFDFFFKIRAYFCHSLLLKKEKFKAKVFKEIDDYINKRLDVVFYLKNIVKFEKLSGMHLNKIQNMSMDYIKKECAASMVKLIDENDFSRRINSINFKIPLNSNLEEFNRLKIVNYFSEKLKNNSMNEIDKQIISFIEDDLKSKINQRFYKYKELNRLNVK